MRAEVIFWISHLVGLEENGKNNKSSRICCRLSVVSRGEVPLSIAERAIYVHMDGDYEDKGESLSYICWSPLRTQQTRKTKEQTTMRKELWLLKLRWPSKM